jgi:hypothetical protein
MQKKEKRYTFLEWVFDVVGFGRFLLYYISVMIVITSLVLSFIWWYTKR